MVCYEPVFVVIKGRCNTMGLNKIHLASYLYSLIRSSCFRTGKVESSEASLIIFYLSIQEIDMRAQEH
jgi:hypothetical protein